MVNGRAWGEGFGFCTPPENIRELRDQSAVVEFLPGWLKEQIAAGNPGGERSLPVKR